MEKNTITSYQLSNLFFESNPEDENTTQFFLITGSPGIGKTDIIKQCLSRRKGNKIYSVNTAQYDYSLISEYNKCIVVFDEIQHPFLEQFLRVNDFSHKTGSWIIIITNNGEKQKKYEVILDSYISNNPFIECFLLNVEQDVITATEYMRNRIHASGRRYWGNEKLTTVGIDKNVSAFKRIPGKLEY
ncbi:MAG: hypothetical protein ACLFR1_13550 [Spirochaetia bacterium]